jgi:tetratricopeptide (TPR) repeat protein
MKDPEGGETPRLSVLRELHEMDPQSLAFVSLANEYNRLGAYDDARQIAIRGLLSHPDSVAGRLALAAAEAGTRRTSEAVAQIEYALSLDPENPRAHGLMAKVFLEDGRSKSALDFARTAVRLDPSNDEYARLLEEITVQIAKRSSEDSENQHGLATPWGEPHDERTEFDPTLPAFALPPDDAGAADHWTLLGRSHPESSEVTVVGDAPKPELRRIATEPQPRSSPGRAAQGFLWRRQTLLWVAAALLGFLAIWVVQRPRRDLTARSEAIGSMLASGDLAALQRAARTLEDIEKDLGALSPVLLGARAEIYARWGSVYGHSVDVMGKAFESARSCSSAASAVSSECLLANTLLSSDSGWLNLLVKEALSETRPTSKPSHFWLSAAMAAQKLGREEDVYNLTTRLLSVDRESKDGFLLLSDWYVRRQNYAAAIRNLDQASALGRFDTRVGLRRFLLNELSSVDAQPGSARKLLEDVVLRDGHRVPDEERGRVALALAVPRLAHRADNEGDRLLELARTGYANSPSYQSLLAGVHLVLGRWEVAQSHYEAALRLEPLEKSHRIALARVSLLKYLTQYELADALLAKIPREVPKFHGEFRFPYGTVQVLPSRFELFEIVPHTKIFPDLESEGLAASLDGEALSEALEATVLVELGRRSRQLGRFEVAQKLLRQSLALLDSSKAQVEMGQIFLARRQLSEAETVFRGVLARDKRNRSARFHLAETLFRMGRYPEAVQTLAPIEQEGRSVPDRELWGAQSALLSGRVAKATAHLNRFLEFDPDNLIALVLAADLRFRAGDRPEAFELFRQLMQRNPEVVDLVLSRSPEAPDAFSGIVLSCLGRIELKRNPERGILLLRRSLRDPVTPEEARFFLGRALLENGRASEEGRRLLRAYLRVQPRGRYRNQASLLLQEAG